MSSLLLKALKSENEGRAPIWLMRQAGRYMPAYQKLRKGRSLLEMFHDPDTIVEVSLLPIQLLNVDAAILFSDILSICDSLGIRWDFEDQKGPVVEKIASRSHSFTIRQAKSTYSHITAAIERLKKELTVPVLGFAGAPFTIASYLIEGGSSKDLKETKKWLYQDPSSFHHLLETITEATIDYLNIQIEAGCDALQLFDSWAHALSETEFRTVCLPYMDKILKSVGTKVPVILFCRGSCMFAEALAQTNPSCISLDWSLEIGKIRGKITPKIALQGNLDPMALYGSQKSIQTKVDHMLQSMKGDKGYIFNLGHGILPDTPFENVKFLVDYVRSH
jgi:uroporphyrinogen decarboxylase